MSQLGQVDWHSRWSFLDGGGRGGVGGPGLVRFTRGSFHSFLSDVRNKSQSTSELGPDRVSDKPSEVKPAFRIAGVSARYVQLGGLLQQRVR